MDLDPDYLDLISPDAGSGENILWKNVIIRWFRDIRGLDPERCHDDMNQRQAAREFFVFRDHFVNYICFYAGLSDGLTSNLEKWFERAALDVLCGREIPSPPLSRDRKHLGGDD